ncbi:MAG: response regulator transcription factor, partial [Planctomycetes bacterium]|nr:response regulator transcription factor [Planctomycetota bacterium]
MTTRILLVEDDRSLGHGIVKNLEHEGYVVTLATDGTEAARVLASEEFDLVILDLMLPGRSGLDVLREFRASGDTTPVLILTAKDSEDDKVLGLELGADDYMTKPFGVKEIIARIRAILRRSASRGGGKSDDDFTMDDLRVVPTELRAYRGQGEISLSPRDVKVLRLLHDRRGKVIDRNTLADEVWGVDYFPESRALDQHISQLRKRIEKDPAQPRIIRT